MSNTRLPEPVCLRVAELRRRGTTDLRAHLADPRNVHVCRQGRVFITTGGRQTVFSYKASDWANPFRVGTRPGEYARAEALAAYAKYLDDLLQDADKRAAFARLRDAKTIGCFCALDESCHRDVILARLATLDAPHEADGAPPAKRAKQ